MRRKICLKCKGKLNWAATTGGIIDGVDAICPNCQIYYKDDEPIAIVRGNRIIKL